jgi:hypothetical protein
MHEYCMAIHGDKKGVNAQRKNTCTQMRIKTSLEEGDKKGVNAHRKNTCTQMRIKTSLEAHEPETKLEPQQIS